MRTRAVARPAVVRLLLDFSTPRLSESAAEQPLLLEEGAGDVDRLQLLRTVDLPVQRRHDLVGQQRRDRVQRVGDPRIGRQRLVADDRRHVIRRPEPLVVLEQHEIHTGDLAIGAEGEHDLRLVFLQRLVANARRNAEDVAELQS